MHNVNFFRIFFKFLIKNVAKEQTIAIVAHKHLQRQRSHLFLKKPIA